MAERFKFQISKLLCCKSSSSSLPVPSIPTVANGKIKPSKSHRSSFKRHVSYAFGCGVGSRSGSDVDRTESSQPPKTSSFLWGSQGKWHVMMKEEQDYIETPRRKIYDGSVVNGEVFPSRKLKLRRRKKKTAGRSRVSASSSTADDWKETESLMIASSRSFSSEGEYSSTIHEVPRVTTRKKTKKNTNRRRVSSSGRFVAVVKRSKDPYEDFKWSMMEVIVEKKMFHKSDLEELLCCFLSLNSTRHHQVIVMAFSEIWDVLFSGRGSRKYSGGVQRSSFKIKTQISHERNW